MRMLCAKCCKFERLRDLFWGGSHPLDHWLIHRDKGTYYTTKLLGGLIQKIHQLDQFNTVRKTISIWHEALWYNDELDKKKWNYSVNYSCTRNPTSTISLILAIFARWILVAFAVLVFFDTKSRVINLLLTEFARAILGEHRSSVFLARTARTANTSGRYSPSTALALGYIYSTTTVQ